MDRRTCAGKPDGTSCGAPAVRGGDYCRHHRPERFCSSRPDPVGAVVAITPYGVEVVGEEEMVLILDARELQQEAASGQYPAEMDLEERVFRQSLRRQGLDPKFLKQIPPGAISRRVRAFQAENLEGIEKRLAERKQVLFRVEMRFQPPARPAADEKAPHPVSLAKVAEVPNDQAGTDLYRSLTMKHTWPVNTDEGFRYFEGEKATIIYRPGELFPEDWWKDEVRQKTLDLLDARFSEMRSELVADVIDLLFLHWIGNGKPPKALITLSQVLQYREVEPERKTLELHWRAMRDVRSIRLRGGAIEDANLFNMDAIRAPQGNLFNLDEPPSADVVYPYAPGILVGDAVSQNPEYLAAYTPRFLTLDPRIYSTAKRLARYLRGEWRRNPESYLPDGPRRYRTWRHHLHDAGINPEDQFTGSKRPSEFLDSLDDQILELCRVGGLHNWFPELHRPERVQEKWEKAADLYHPEDRGKLRDLPLRGRLEAFQSLRVHLPPPALLHEKLHYYARKRAAREAQQQALQREIETRKALAATRQARK